MASPFKLQPSSPRERELRRERALRTQLPPGAVTEDYAKSAVSGVRSGAEQSLGLGDISTMQQALMQRAMEKLGFGARTGGPVEAAGGGAGAEATGAPAETSLADKAATLAKYTSPFSLLPTSEQVGDWTDKTFGRDDWTRHQPITSGGEDINLLTNLATGLVGGPEDAAKVAAPKMAMMLGLGSRFFKTAEGKAALELASQMHAEGRSPEAILGATGLHRQHGDWKREISDQDMKLSEPAKETLMRDPEGYKGQLGPSAQFDLFGPPKPGLIEHPELFAEHPELADIPVDASLNYSGTRGGGYMAPGQGMPEKITMTGTRTGDIRDIAAHETQHAAQFQSGLPHGGSPSDKTLQPAMQKVKREAERQYGTLNNEMINYQSARAGGDFTKYPELARQWRAANPEKARLMDSALGVSTEPAGPMRGYHHLAGETEARNVAKRADLSPEGIRKIPPWETQDVPDELQIVRRRVGRDQLAEQMAAPGFTPFADTGMDYADELKHFAQHDKAAEWQGDLFRAPGQMSGSHDDALKELLAKYPEAEGAIEADPTKYLGYAEPAGPRGPLVQEMAAPRKPPTKGKKAAETDVYDPWTVRTPIENKPTRTGAFDYSAPKASFTEGAPMYNPPRGVPERTRDLLSRQDVKDKMLEGIERGRPLMNWYETGPLRQAFIDVLGHNEGPVRFEQFIKAVGATSPRSDVGTNIRNASFYYGLAKRGEKLPKENPYPYGHLAQNLHRGNIGKVLPLGGSNVEPPGFDPFKNPKPIGYTAGLLGDPNRVAVDTHAFRAPAMLGADTRFLETSLQGDKGDPVRNIMREYEEGKLSLEDVLKRGAYWSPKPRENEYSAWQDYYRELARKAGMEPRQAQAAGWTGFGEMTGLESSPDKAFMDFMEDRLLHTQAQRDTQLSPREILTNMILGKKGKALLTPLLAAGGGAAAGASMLNRDDQGGGNAL